MAKRKMKIFCDTKYIAVYLPEYADVGSSGVDLRADIDYPLFISPFDRALVKTGLKIGIPLGFEGQVRPRSGLALKQGITVLNSPGTIDSTYRGEIGVILYNSTSEMQEIQPGDRIAQLVFAPVTKAIFEKVNSIEELGQTERGDGGFGHTGVK